MANVFDRLDELVKECEAVGLLDQVEAYDALNRIMAMADLLGYDVTLALDPEIPLTRL